MTLEETLNSIVGQLPAEHQRQVVEFAQFLAWQNEHGDWQRIGQAQLAGAYGYDEPEYTAADSKRQGKS